MAQQIQIDIPAGREVLDADCYRIDGGNYVFLNGDTVVRTVPIADIVEEYDESGEQTKGIMNIFSRT
ncbi:MAG: hypothetical protein PHP59_10220 [Methanofollis sp.]|uniref:hypothetical protein n=1 Tax=Methanofollis sp. TaxID=2052835 RepID=UPI00263756B9|nr:hypothetical protein [Methanofollis sp.]MDD4255732.1 hypothetical protein [Methanofollis sp.]